MLVRGSVLNKEKVRFLSTKIKKIEYMCRYCGKKEIRTNLQGHPMPGTCPRKTGNKPHSWIRNREMQ